MKNASKFKETEKLTFLDTNFLDQLKHRKAISKCSRIPAEALSKGLSCKTHTHTDISVISNQLFFTKKSARQTSQVIRSLQELLLAQWLKLPFKAVAKISLSISVHLLCPLVLFDEYCTFLGAQCRSKQATLTSSG